MLQSQHIEIETKGKISPIAKTIASMKCHKKEVLLATSG